MLLHLSEQLDIPLRERNVILVAAWSQGHPQPGWYRCTM
jgi:hypothetical protein